MIRPKRIDSDPESRYLRCMAAARPKARLRRPSTWLGRYQYLVSPAAADHLTDATHAARELAARCSAAGMTRQADHWRKRAEQATQLAGRAGHVLLGMSALDPWIYGAVLAARRAEPDQVMESASDRSA